MYRGFAISQRGASHIAKETPCQDAADYVVGDGYAVAAVSDGHGGEKYFRSACGSQFAVAETLRCLQEFLKNYGESLINTTKEGQHELLKHLSARIISAWQDEIKKHFANQPLAPHEQDICSKYDIPADFQSYFYGATLLYACITPDYSFASQIGDGACVFFDTDTHPGMPAELEDARLGFSLTTSLCDAAAIDNFRHHFISAAADPPWGLPKAVFLYTDGVVDSYERASFLAGFNRSVFDEMNKDEENTKAQLEHWLPELSAQGSQDDVSMAGVYRHDDAEGQEV